MKLIISQCGQQLFTCGDCQVYSIATMEVPGANGGKRVGVPPVYSVGVGGISFGMFADKEQASSALKGIAEFLGGKNTSFTIPPCASASEPEAPEGEAPEAGAATEPDGNTEPEAPDAGAEADKSAKKTTKK